MFYSQLYAFTLLQRPAPASHGHNADTKYATDNKYQVFLYYIMQVTYIHTTHALSPKG
jgi:hypothetical protein